MAEYIDREAAVKAVKDYAHMVIDKGRKSLDTVDDTLNIVARIEKIPAADVAPVVHGRWDESKEHFYLNNGCKEWINFYCSECDAPNNSPTDYCPNCGAKMDGGADNG